MVLDTDTYNEIDDQFAVVYSLISRPVHVEAIYAAPFFNSRSNGPGDGMHKSYEEILRLLEQLDVDRHEPIFAREDVYHGSDRYLGRADTPVSGLHSFDQHTGSSSDALTRGHTIGSQTPVPAVSFSTGRTLKDFLS